METANLLANLQYYTGTIKYYKILFSQICVHLFLSP